jgi:ABC-type branched-subunit amino acid transport system ATPase component
MNGLVIENVSRSFGGVQALENVSFVVEPGTIHGLIGPNGAGKTTLINVLSGLIPPSAGRMTYKDHDLHGLASHQMAAIGVARTFQNIRLFSHMSCLENVEAGQHLTSRRSFFPRLLQLPSARREDARLQQRAVEMLARVGLKDKALYQSRNLSYGERRRLEIARALSLNPSLLLLDEPVAGMRQGEAVVVADLLRSLCREGMTILLIEHNMSFVMSLCSRITVLDFGRVLTTGTPEEVRTCQEVIEAYLGVGGNTCSM